MQTDGMRRLGLALRSPSFLLGGAVVAVLLVLAAAGPEIAPHSPYVGGRLQLVEGELQKAPLLPSRTFPLGTDANGVGMLSLLLYGARTTLMMVFFAATIRLLLGLVLGALAGWWAGSLFDRVVQWCVDLFSILPDLILAVIVIQAAGPENGQAVFIAGLAAAGWGNVAQILRSHVLSIRQQDYIVSARAMGLTQLGVLSRHVLPNLTGTVVALSSLEIGRSLLLLGELGFIQVFLGGGILDPGDLGAGTVLIADIPEWGAILGSTWRWFRTYPWLPGAPAAAFFISIIGFNLFGYGLNRFLERGRYYPSGKSVVSFLASIFVVLAGLQFALSRSGPEMWLRADADAFDESRAMSDVRYLTQSSFSGREEGSAEAALSAAYIGHVFREAGLTSLRTGEYYQSFPVNTGQIIYPAHLKLLGDEPLQLDRQDGLVYDFHDSFQAFGAWDTDELLFVGNPASTGHAMFPRGLYFLLDEDAPLLRVHIVGDEDLDLYTSPSATSTAGSMRDFPAFQIGEGAAAAVLARSGYDLQELADSVEHSVDRVIVPLEPARVEAGVDYHAVLGVNTAGYLPGRDSRLSRSRILVAACYTTPSSAPGFDFPGADENASAVGVMLEVLRLMDEMDFEPRRTIVFAAVTEAGLDYLLRNPALESGESDDWTLVVLDSLGAGTAELAYMESGGGLSSQFEDSAKLMGTAVSELKSGESGTADYVRQMLARSSFSDRYSAIIISRPGDALSGTPDDGREHLDRGLLRDAGAVVTHFLLMLGSQ